MVDWKNHELDVSVSHHFSNKRRLTESAFSDGFTAFQVTADQLAKAVKRGWAYAPVFRGPRKKENFRKCGVISLDFDGDVAASQIANDPIVKEALTVLYTTFNDTPERRRFRLVFALKSPIERGADWEAATRTLALRLGSDLAATDAARIFYGNTKARVEVYERGLSDDRVKELVEGGRNAHQAEDSGGKWVATGRSVIKLDKDQRVRKAGRGESVALAVLAKRTSIHCPKHEDRNASAFVIESQRGVKGVHCSACGLSYWPEENSYDFNTFDTALRMAKDLGVSGFPCACGRLHITPPWL